MRYDRRKREIRQVASAIPPILIIEGMTAQQERREMLG